MYSIQCKYSVLLAVDCWNLFKNMLKIRHHICSLGNTFEYMTSSSWVEFMFMQWKIYSAGLKMDTFDRRLDIYS